MVQPINIGSAFPDQQEIATNMLRAAQIKNALAEIGMREQELADKKALRELLSGMDTSGDLNALGRNLMRVNPAAGVNVLELAEKQAERKRQMEAMSAAAGGEASPAQPQPAGPVGAFDLTKPMPEIPKLMKAEQEGRLSDEGRGILSAYRSQVGGAQQTPQQPAQPTGGGVFGPYLAHQNAGIRAMAQQGIQMAKGGLFKDAADLNGYVQKLAEFDARFNESALSREERQQAAKDLQQQLLANQIEVARITAGLRPPPQQQIVTTEGGEMRTVVPGTTTTQPLTDERGQPLKKGATERPLSEKVKETAREIKGTTNALDRLSSSFKDAFGGKGVFGVGAETSLEAAARGVPGFDKDAAEWWRDYRKNNEIAERHAIFGASLTGGEKEAWQRATIHPGMAAQQIKRNLEIRRQLSQKMMQRLKEEEIASGQDAAKVEALYGAGMEAPQRRATDGQPRKRYNPASGKIEEY